MTNDTLHPTPWNTQAPVPPFPVPDGPDLDPVETRLFGGGHTTGDGDDCDCDYDDDDPDDYVGLDLDPFAESLFSGGHTEGGGNADEVETVAFGGTGTSGGGPTEDQDERPA